MNARISFWYKTSALSTVSYHSTISLRRAVRSTACESLAGLIGRDPRFWGLRTHCPSSSDVRRYSFLGRGRRGSDLRFLTDIVILIRYRKTITNGATKRNLFRLDPPPHPSPCVERADLG